jgi:cyclohexyl-isocyanide hydratase
MGARVEGRRFQRLAREQKKMKLGIPVYEGVNLLDVAGPLEMFYWASRKHRLDITIVTSDGKGVTSMNGVRFDAHASFAQTPNLDVLWVPGGDPRALTKMLKDRRSDYISYLQQIGTRAKWVCSVCEGALLLARAGLLDGHKATTHWAFTKCLQRFPKVDVVARHPRFVVSGNRLTGGGISSGLDEALKLVALLFGEDTAKSVQETTQYFPRPPVKGRIPATPDCPIDWETSANPARR